MALYQGLPVIPLFIFDVNILDDLVSDDPRITFIYETLSTLNSLLIRFGSSFLVKKGDPVKIWNELIDLYDINAVYVNEDYEPYALSRDDIIESLLGKKNIPLHKFKDQVIFAGNDILKSDATPYTVFTPYKKRWILKLQESPIELNSDPGQSKKNFLRQQNRFPSLMEIGFKKSKVRVRPYNLSAIKEYDRFRNSPSADKTSYLSPYLRFGTVSIRRVVRLAYELNTVFLNELIWREFFMQILFHFPHVVTANFKPAYNDIQWRNEEKEFLRWCNGETGYPIVDAGMHQLNRTGYMHNRVRMITSSFLCRDLLIDW